MGVSWTPTVISCRFGLIGCLATLALGCGGPSATVTGVVLLDGEPIEATGKIIGKVVLEPTSAGGVPATGSVGEGGRFEVATGAKAGLEPGDYGVAVSVLRSLPSKTPGIPPWTERLSHPKYGSSRTSGLALKVGPGANEFELEIESAPKRR